MRGRGNKNGQDGHYGSKDDEPESLRYDTSNTSQPGAVLYMLAPTDITSMGETSTWGPVRSM